MARKKIQDIQVTVDAIVFGYSKEEGVSVLLIKRKYDPFKGSWAIPGGFVMDDESLEEAVKRELYEETGVKINYLEQLYTFGEPNRDPRKRIVSVAYFGVVNSSQFNELEGSTDAEEAVWFNIKKLPKLAFDHKVILKVAIERLRNKVLNQPIGFELLDRKFPFSELEHLYSSMLDRPIDKKSFKKKIMSLQILEELIEKGQSNGAGKSVNLFKFNKATYDRLKKEGMRVVI